MGEFFDLNVDHLNTYWPLKYAVREVIANAMDEQILSATQDINIFKDANGHWHIRDYGRGIQEKHFVLTENYEKIYNGKILGQFGVGLKDALAVFYSHRIDVIITSKYGVFQPVSTEKKGFEEIKTIHVKVSKPENPNMIGTDVKLIGVTDEDVLKAKSLFIAFSKPDVIEQTRYGDVLRKTGKNGEIYILGLLLATDRDFSFSYNITSLTYEIQRELNRDRNGLSRSVYGKRVRDILLCCHSDDVIQEAYETILSFSNGKRVGEFTERVSSYFIKEYNKKHPNVVYVNTNQLLNEDKNIDYAKLEGKTIVPVLGTVYSELNNSNNESVETLDRYTNNHNSWDFLKCVVNKNELLPYEVKTLQNANCILSLLGENGSLIHDIVIVSTFPSDKGIAGLWEEATQTIYIKRNRLSNVESFAETLLHEYIHALTKTKDKTIEFENELTRVIGKLAVMCLKSK